ncbi:dihydropteroate synthase [bacterium A37T11]|nr:dihydropteroate synthase [bacterium A37T11]
MLSQLTIQIQGKLLDLSTPRLMGIINVTPDSFFDGGTYNQVDKAVAHAGKLLQEGADMIDLGAYSSRPGAAEVSVQEETDRIVPVVEALLKQYPDALLSIDTFRAPVAEAAIRAGAGMINDISGGSLDESMFATVARLGVPYVLMHMRGTPATMQKQTQYTDLLWEMCQYYGERIARLRALKVKDIILDPGFGFAKTLDQNYELLRRLDELHAFGLPILGALSRKSMIYKLLGGGPENALNGTTVLNTWMLTKGVQLIRVHDVKEAREAVLLFQKAESG